jgi:hypothetical protein
MYGILFILKKRKKGKKSEEKKLGNTIWASPICAKRKKLIYFGYSLFTPNLSV